MDDRSHTTCLSVWNERWTIESPGSRGRVIPCALRSRGLIAVSTHRTDRGLPDFLLQDLAPACLQSQVPVDLCFQVGLLDLFPRSRLHPEGTGLLCTQPQKGSAVAELMRHTHLQGGSGLCRRQAFRQVPASRTHEGVLTRCQDQPGGIRRASSRR